MVMDCVDDGNGEKDITNSQIILFVEGIFLRSTMANHHLGNMLFSNHLQQI